ncbi:MAG: type I restriction enzyme HsdR N-terminal domain-containing protein [Bacteroidales bacterium]|nr:type I restriction enzyme HsdR N-terminal domain-containing protein [Bacteroidales bacterium]
MKPLNLPSYSFKIKSKEQKKYIFDTIRKKFVLLTPEEWVRQNFVRYLVHEKHYSSQLIAIEMTLEYNRLFFRADVVVYNRNIQPVLIVECKAPGVKLKQEHFDQIARYNMQLRVEYLIVTNGINHYCCRIDFEERKYVFLKDIPDFSGIQ